jgi:outer membrane immunogenic protein
MEVIMSRLNLFAATIVVGTALTFGLANAADLEPAPVYRAPPPVAAPVPVPYYNWTGIYLGVNGGYTFGQSTPMSLYGSDFSAFDFSANGWLLGGTAGAQIQSGHTVIGVEADIDWANITGSASGNVFHLGTLVGPATLSSTVNSISTLRTRIGYAADNWLFYVTGGVAITNEASTLTGGAAGAVCNAGTCNSPTDLHLGLAAGAGIEYGITPNLSAKGEYVWVGAGAVNTLKENMVRAGLNWRFGM